MVSSWFLRSSSDDAGGTGTGGRSGRNSLPSVKDLAALLAASKPSKADTPSRFSGLLLEHGERVLQDWAVVVYTSPIKAENTNSAIAASARTSSLDGIRGSNGANQPNKIHWEQQMPSPAKANRSSSGSNRSFSKAGGSGGSQSHATTTADKDVHPSIRWNKIEGRLHLCSRSIVLEPYENSRGIVRCPFAKMEGAPHEFPPDEHEIEPLCIEFVARRHMVMKAHNVIGPFDNVNVPIQVRCTFLHSTPRAFVDLCGNLFDMAKSSKQSTTAAAGPTNAAGADGPASLDALLKPMLDRPFDSTNLLDVREQVLAPQLRCFWIQPLQAQPGVLVLSHERLYVQPCAGVLEATETRALHWPLAKLAATARRYHGLRDCALELFWKDGRPSLLVALERRHDREAVLRLLPPKVPCLTDRDFVLQAVQEWQAKSLSNFDYLLALNAAAGRSFHDLSRYPVFPWVISDWTSSKLDLSLPETFRDLSKPIGALNSERLDYFKTRMDGMHDMGEPFLYGTHYSAPGYVLYFLVRSMPEHMLCLQNGKFDAPDRMFHSLARCYECVLKNHADLKELIPEFYAGDFDFLINARGLQLGATQTGDRVDDVHMPPWARSARDFIKKCRQALESDHCTQMLPRWIDLMFGSLSRGDAAKQANNLFHPISYMGPSDLADMQTEQERYTSEMQANEFGIVPDQLFGVAHPLQGESVEKDELVLADLGRASSKDDSMSAREAWELLDAPMKPGDFRPNALIMSSTQELVSEQGDHRDRFESDDADAVKIPNNDESDLFQPSAQIALAGTGEPAIEVKPVEKKAPTQSSPPIPAVVQTSSPPPPATPQVDRASGSLTASEWDMKVLERSQIHNDAVSGCMLLISRDDTSTPSLLATTSLDGGLMIHHVSLGAADTDDYKSSLVGAGFGTSLRFSYSTIMSRGTQGMAGSGGGGAAASSTSSKLTEFRAHSTRDPLASLVLAADGAGGHVAFAGGHDDVVLAYGVQSACAVASVYSHRDAVTGLDLLARRRPEDNADSALWLPQSTHILSSGSWDATVKLWSVTVAPGETVAIHREPLAELFDAESSIVSVSSHPMIPQNSGGLVIAAGCADGSFCVWHVHQDGVQVVLHKEIAKRGSGPCSVVQWVHEPNGLHLFAAFTTGKVASYTLLQGQLKRNAAVSVGISVLSMRYAPGQGYLLVGCADGGLRLIPVRDGIAFESKPTLWRQVNNKSSPGISSISIAYTSAASQEEKRRCICCAGGEDGSVALFELKRVIKQQQQQQSSGFFS